jgi:hypothetical protein
MLNWKGRTQEKLHPQFEILETASIRSILNKCSFNSFVVFDLDNTVFESNQELGSHQWFESLCIHANKSMDNKEQAFDYALRLYHLVQHYTKVKPVEEETARVIQLLQDINIPVIALTARGRPIFYPTLLQLRSIGVDFSRNWSDLAGAFYFIPQNENVMFSQGIIFCSGGDKGFCLNHFFHYLVNYSKSFPEHLIMIEDTPKHVAAVGKVVADKGCDFTGLRYNYLDQKASQFKMDMAIEQLTSMSVNFPEKSLPVLTALQFPFFSPKKLQGNEENVLNQPCSYS